MTSMIAFCGLDCSACAAYLATQADDEGMRQMVLEEWRVTYCNPELPPETVICDGCSSTGRLGGYCAQCPVRACATQHKVINCAYCEEFICTALQQFFVQAPELRDRLLLIRSHL